MSLVEILTPGASVPVSRAQGRLLQRLTLALSSVVDVCRGDLSSPVLVEVLAVLADAERVLALPAGELAEFEAVTPR